MEPTSGDASSSILARRHSVIFNQPVIDQRGRVPHIAGLRAAGVMWAGTTGLIELQSRPIFCDMDKLPKVAVFAGADDLSNTVIGLNQCLAAARQIDIAEVQIAESRLYWFAGTGRISKCSVTQLVNKADRQGLAFHAIEVTSICHKERHEAGYPRDLCRHPGGC